jgi:hypothetical protein
LVKRAVDGVPAIIVLAVGCTVYLVAYYFFAWKLGLLRSDEIAEGRQLIERLLGRRGRSNR